MTPEERAAAIYEVARDGFEATDGTTTVVASGASLEGAMVRLTLSVTRSDTPVTLGNPYYFVNPPVAVEVGDDAVVDPAAALTEMLLDVVR